MKTRKKIFSKYFFPPNIFFFNFFFPNFFPQKMFWNFSPKNIFGRSRIIHSLRENKKFCFPRAAIIRQLLVSVKTKGGKSSSAEKSNFLRRQKFLAHVVAEGSKIWPESWTICYLNQNQKNYVTLKLVNLEFLKVPLLALQRTGSYRKPLFGMIWSDTLWWFFFSLFVWDEKSTHDFHWFCQPKITSLKQKAAKKKKNKKKLMRSYKTKKKKKSKKKKTRKKRNKAKKQKKRRKAKKRKKRKKVKFLKHFDFYFFFVLFH